jgi:hypothetical protein
VTDVITPQRIAGTFEAQRALRSRHIASLGLRPEVLLQPLALRVGSIAWIDAETFAFEQHLVVDVPVEQAILFLVTDSHRDALDIAAWQPSSRRLGTWCHRAWALGQDTIYAPRLDRHGALPVWRNPLRWLKAGRRGVVLIQPRLASAFLCDAGPLLAEDVEHGRQLKERLARPSPRILVPSSTLSTRVA